MLHIPPSHFPTLSYYLVHMLVCMFGCTALLRSRGQSAHMCMWVAVHYHSMTAMHHLHRPVQICTQALTVLLTFMDNRPVSGSPPTACMLFLMRVHTCTYSFLAWSPLLHFHMPTTGSHKHPVCMWTGQLTLNTTYFYKHTIHTYIVGEGSCILVWGRGQLQALHTVHIVRQNTCTFGKFNCMWVDTTPSQTCTSSEWWGGGWSILRGVGRKHSIAWSLRASPQRPLCMYMNVWKWVRVYD